MRRTLLCLFLSLLLLFTACAPAAVQTEPPTEAPTQATTEVPTEAPTEAPTEELTEALPEETEAPTEPPERPEHTVRIQVSDNCDYTVTNAEGQTTRQGDDGRPRGDLVVYSIDLYGFDTDPANGSVGGSGERQLYTGDDDVPLCLLCGDRRCILCRDGMYRRYPH